MKLLRVYITVICCLVASFAKAQQLDIPFLQSLLDKESFVVDTLMKSKGYVLMEKEQDSTMISLYYNHVERNSEGPSWVRSLTLMDASVGELHSRLVKYRTYNKEEYLKMNAYLLTNNFKTKNKFSFTNEEHVVLTNGKQDIKIKTIQNKLRDGRLLKIYEFELGK